MGRNRFVKPEVVRLDLDEGDWIEVKKQLTWHEQKHVADGALLADFKGEPLVHMNMAGMELRRILTWVVDWSFRDERDKPVKFGEDAVRKLDPETAEEINQALDRHIEALEQEKKAIAGSTS